MRKGASDVENYYFIQSKNKFYFTWREVDPMWKWRKNIDRNF